MMQAGLYIEREPEGLVNNLATYTLFTPAPPYDSSFVASTQCSQ